MRFVYENSVTRVDALAELCELWEAMPGSSVVPLDRAFGRVLAEDARALVSLPVKRSSKRDGIAVRSSDFACGAPDTSKWQRGCDFAQADTGDDFPDGFDAVVAVEEIVFENDVPRFRNPDLTVNAGDGVNQSGSIVRAGDVLVRASARLTPELVAALAVGGYAQVRVLDRPRVAFIPTGSELVPWGSIPQRGQNIEANGLMVKGMLAEWGADVLTYPIVRDDRASLESALDRALEAADIVLINGGSSRGDEDFNSQLLEMRGSYFRHGVRAVPGRPVGMAIIDGKPVVNIPGPVLAAFLSVDWLVRGLVAHFSGTPAPRRQTVQARLTTDVQKPVPFERFVRVNLFPAFDGDEAGGLACSPVAMDAGVPANLRAHAMLVLPIGCAGASAGDEVTVELLLPEEELFRSWRSA